MSSEPESRCLRERLFGFPLRGKTLYDGGNAILDLRIRKMTARSSLTVVLAAGEGTRMRSVMPKVLHSVAGEPLLAHVLAAAPKGAGTALAVVVGPDHAAVAQEAKRARPDVQTFIQRERLGTAHAVLAAREAIARGANDLLIAFGDTPLISAETFARLRAPLKNGTALAVLGFRALDPTGYGRLLVEGNRLVAIREHAEASGAERAIDLCNAGVMAFDGARALEIIEKIGNANSKREYYLTDAVGIVRDLGLEAVVIETSEDEVRGINTKAQLAEAEQVMHARLRPGTSLGEGVRIGNFVETKASVLDAGVKVNHLSYIGDAHIGANSNVGAGTITCNYDGFGKHRTEIGEGAFVGTNSSLVAPVKIGNGAYIGSGSVITRDVPADALAVERSQQTIREDGAKRIRELKTRGNKP